MFNEYKQLIKNSSFIYVWLSQLLSQMTINMMNFLLIIMIYEKTHSAIAVSFLWIAYSLPALLIGPIAATVVDLVDKRMMLMVTNLLQALVILAYALSYHSPFFLLYGVVLAYSFLDQFYVPSEASSLPYLVSKKDLPQANGLFFLTQQSAIILGYTAAGLINKYIGFVNSLFLCAFFVFLAFISVSFLPKIKSYGYSASKVESSLARFFKKFIEGYQFIKSHSSILMPFCLLLGLHTVLAVVITIMPVLAVEIMDIDLNHAGILVVAPAAMGAILSALIVPKLLKNGWRKKKIIELCLFLAGLIFLFLAFNWLGFRGPLRTMVGSISIALAGFTFVGITIPSQTYLQEVTPGGLRGRVFGNFWFIVTVVNVLPILFSGAISEIFGVKFLFVILGLVSFSAFALSRKYTNDILRNGFVKNQQ